MSLPSAPWNASLSQSLKEPTSMTQRCPGRMWTSWWVAPPVFTNSTPLCMQTCASARLHKQHPSYLWVCLGGCPARLHRQQLWPCG